MTTKFRTLPAKSAPVDSRRGYGTVNLAQYAVEVDGKIVGRVFQDRAETMQSYSGVRYGYTTMRTVWAYETEDGMGISEFDTRKAAVEDMMDWIEGQS
jgi:hypothetical protein